MVVQWFRCCASIVECMVLITKILHAGVAGGWGGGVQLNLLLKKKERTQHVGNHLV